MDSFTAIFSAEKSRLMTFSFRSVDHPDIVFNGVVLPEADTHKHLGITLSSNLSWSSHIDTILGSVSPMADVLRKLKCSVNKESLEQIYLALLDLYWNMVVIFGIIVIKEIRKVGGFSTEYSPKQSQRLGKEQP